MMAAPSSSSFRVPEDLSIHEMINFWERGFGDTPSPNEWEHEDKIRNRESLEIVFKVYSKQIKEFSFEKPNNYTLKTNEVKGGSRNKVHHYKERVIFFIRYFSN